MKRFIAGSCLAVSLVVFAIPSHAQTVWWGIKGGANIATVGGANVQDVNAFTRLIGGAFIKVDLSRNVALQPELLYAQKGMKQQWIVDTGQAGQVAVDTKWKIDYVEVPLLFRVQPGGTMQFQPHAFAGPTFAIRTLCKARSESTASQFEEQADCETFLGSNSVKDLDYGFAVGGGAEMSVGSAFIGVDARYVVGLTRVMSNGMKNRAFGIMAGVRFPLSGATAVAAR